uniref:PRO2369 n=1 Tax=Homo sapiens TaxID=9606 RepID=Q9P168_HUMAN|nr:PRO2369 [Homo sapiens]
MILAVGLSVCGFYCVEACSFYIQLSFYHEGMLNFTEYFFGIYRNGHMVMSFILLM